MSINTFLPDDLDLSLSRHYLPAPGNNSSNKPENKADSLASGQSEDSRRRHENASADHSVEYDGSIEKKKSIFDVSVLFHFFIEIVRTLSKDSLDDVGYAQVSLLTGYHNYVHIHFLPLSLRVRLYILTRADLVSQVYVPDFSVNGSRRGLRILALYNKLNYLSEDVPGNFVQCLKKGKVGKQ